MFGGILKWLDGVQISKGTYARIADNVGQKNADTDLIKY